MQRIYVTPSAMCWKVSNNELCKCVAQKISVTQVNIHDSNYRLRDMSIMVLGYCYYVNITVGISKEIKLLAKFVQFGNLYDSITSLQVIALL